jgi:hypothetical protein
MSPRRKAGRTWGGDRQVRVCGVLLSPPQAHCLLCDDFGEMWWPKEKPMPDLMEIERRRRELLESVGGADSIAAPTPPTRS